jgi:hypothetical protein
VVQPVAERKPRDPPGSRARFRVIGMGALIGAFLVFPRMLCESRRVPRLAVADADGPLPPRLSVRDHKPRIAASPHLAFVGRNRWLTRLNAAVPVNRGLDCSRLCEPLHIETLALQVLCRIPWSGRADAQRARRDPRHCRVSHDLLGCPPPSQAGRFPLKIKNTLCTVPSWLPCPVPTAAARRWNSSSRCAAVAGFSGVPSAAPFGFVTL